MDRQRIDRWLWHARIVKTRTQAAELAAGGQVRVNRDKVRKSSHAVKIGDVITMFWGGRVRVVEVAGFAERRVSAPDVPALYVDHSPPKPAKSDKIEAAVPARPSGSGRPTKKERREIDRFKARRT